MHKPIHDPKPARWWCLWIASAVAWPLVTAFLIISSGSEVIGGIIWLATGLFCLVGGIYSSFALAEHLLSRRRRPNSDAIFGLALLFMVSGALLSPRLATPPAWRWLAKATSPSVIMNESSYDPESPRWWWLWIASAIGWPAVVVLISQLTLKLRSDSVEMLSQLVIVGLGFLALAGCITSSIVLARRYLQSRGRLHPLTVAGFSLLFILGAGSLFGVSCFAACIVLVSNA